jgi:hypothetical protein
LSKSIETRRCIGACERDTNIDRSMVWLEGRHHIQQDALGRQLRAASAVPFQKRKPLRCNTSAKRARQRRNRQAASIIPRRTCPTNTHQPFPKLPSEYTPPPKQKKHHPAQQLPATSVAPRPLPAVPGGCTYRQMVQLSTATEGLVRRAVHNWKAGKKRMGLCCRALGVSLRDFLFGIQLGHNLPHKGIVGPSGKCVRLLQPCFNY